MSSPSWRNGHRVNIGRFQFWLSSSTTHWSTLLRVRLNLSMSLSVSEWQTEDCICFTYNSWQTSTIKCVTKYIHWLGSRCFWPNTFLGNVLWCGLLEWDHLGVLGGIVHYDQDVYVTPGRFCKGPMRSIPTLLNGTPLMGSRMSGADAGLFGALWTPLAEVFFFQ